MFCLTPEERKVLFGLAILIMAGGFLRFSNADQFKSNLLDKKDTFQSMSVSSYPLVINVNKASSSQLEKIPGIGPVIASRLIRYREVNGPFKTVEELEKVKGLGQKKILAIRDYISF
tara:strand:- start:892 stop:1242 length:351 start_codon:yes stop_codon:yes gene_type:complete